MDNECDHNGLSFQENTWTIRCELCKKEWGSTEVRKALLSLEADRRQIDEIERALNWIQRDIAYIKRQIGAPKITITGVEE